MVNEVVKPEKLEPEAMRLAKALGANPPIAFAQAKGMMHASFDIDYTSFLSLEGKVQALLTGTQDFTEGILAFMEKRKPDFIGR
jgi:enoyl-CoA hydratase/carnithine racemase